LFDGGFARRLIELGRSDAQARRAELMSFFERAPDEDTSAPLEPHDGGPGWTIPPPAVG
jgi:NTE family protein